MKGFKFTDFKCLAMMFLIIMAFCGDAEQYLLMAATLIWLIAKVLELHRSRKKEPPTQKGKVPTKPVSSPAVQPSSSCRTATETGRGKAPGNRPGDGNGHASPYQFPDHRKAAGRLPFRRMVLGNGKAAGTGGKGRFGQDTPFWCSRLEFRRCAF